MKIFALLFITLFSLVAEAHDYYILPNFFFVPKGERLMMHLYVGDDFAIEEERPVQKYITKEYQWITSVQNRDMLAVYADSTMPVFNEATNFEGNGLMAMQRNYARISLPSEKFTAYLKEEGLDDILLRRANMPHKDSDREKYTRYLKCLVNAGVKHNDLYKKRLGHNLEIILLQDPYKLKTGDILIAQLFFKDRQLKNAALEAICKDSDGKIHKQKLHTDSKGKVSFKLLTAGAWIVRITYMEPSATNDADWESYWASYTFGIK